MKTIFSSAITALKCGFTTEINVYKSLS